MRVRIALYSQGMKHMTLRKYGKIALSTAVAALIAGSAMAAGSVLTDADGNPVWQNVTYYGSTGAAIGGRYTDCSGKVTSWGTKSGSVGTQYENGPCN